MVTLERLNKMTEIEVKAVIASLKDKDSIRMVATDADVIDTVASTPGAIGFVEERADHRSGKRRAG